MPLQVSSISQKDNEHLALKNIKKKNKKKLRFCSLHKLALVCRRGLELAVAIGRRSSSRRRREDL